MDVALNVPDHQAYLSIARWYHVPGWIKRYSGDKVVSGNDLGWIPPNDAMCMAIRSLFTPDEFKLNPWSEEHIAAFTGIVDKRHTEIAVMGPAAATKSETFGLLLDLHYFTSPFDTTCRLISTDLKGLKQRSWNSVTKYYSILKKEGATAVFSRQTLAILNADDDDENIASAIQKAGIFAYALKSATLEEGISKCVGTHWPFGSVVLLADEAQQVNPHFYEGLSNLFIGTEDVRLISLGNPMRLMDALSDRAEPEHGWGSVTVEDHEWCSRRDALVIHFDGEKSPALVEPDEYPFLINQKGIDAVLRENHGRKTSNGYMSMVRGWWSTGDGADLLITMSYIKKFNAMDQVEWSISPEFVVAGFDPGYGGDDAILQLADVGLFSNGIYGIAFRDPIIIDIDTSSDVPVQYQMSSQIDAVRRKQPFQLTRMAADESGLQRTSDVVEMEAREQGIIRVNFSARASYNLVSLYDNTPAFEKYGNFVTEIWARLADLIQFGQVRNLPEQVAKELSMRILLPKRPLRLESKLDLKKRLKRSPDNADAATLTSYAAIESGALNPGASIYHRQGGIFTSVHKPNFPTTDYSEHDFSEPEVFN